MIVALESETHAIDDTRLAPILNSSDAGTNEIEAPTRRRALVPVPTLNVHLPGAAVALTIPVAASGEYSPFDEHDESGTAREPGGRA